MIREIAYSEVQTSLKTGDLVLFHGIETVSKLIEIIEWSFWSHVGMVILPGDIGLSGDEPLFWEATASGDGIVDVISGVPKESGPMLVPLSQRIQVDLDQHYDTHFKVKYLNRELTVDELHRLKDFIYIAHNWGFPTEQQLLKFYLEGRHSNVAAPDGMAFCSQLTADTFMKLGFLSTKYVSNGYCPDDFNKGDNIPSLQPFYFIDGARLK